MNVLQESFFNSIPVGFLGNLTSQNVYKKLNISVWQQDGTYVVRALLPGIAKEDVCVDVKDQELFIEGKQRPYIPEGAKVMLFGEQLSVFRQSLIFPVDADLTNVNAKMSDGVLTLIIGKKASSEQKIVIT